MTTAAGATLAFQYGTIDGLAWMILVGTGTYLGYTPFTASLFDRFVAVSRQPVPAAFLITVADAFGYVGSVALLLVHDFATRTDWVPFFARSVMIVCVCGMVAMGLEILLSRMGSQLSSVSPRPQGGTAS